VAVVYLWLTGGFHHHLDFRFSGGFRIFQDYVLSPKLLSKGAKLQPVVVIFGILAGGQIAGIPGIFFSVPVLATFRILYRQLKKKLLDSATTGGDRISLGFHDGDSAELAAALGFDLAKTLIPSPPPAFHQVS
jgi:predicted PurR-regulated permease PerM